METKICTCCKKNKLLSEYNVKKNGYILTFCKLCQREKVRIAGRSHYSRNKKAKAEYYINYKKTATFSEKKRIYKREISKNLSDTIVVNWLSKKLKTNAKEIRSIPGLIEAERTRLKLHRKLAEIRKGDSETIVCSCCNKRKPIDFFKLKKDSRRGPDYKYRSGKCWECEKKYNNERKKRYGKK